MSVTPLVYFESLWRYAMAMYGYEPKEELFQQAEYLRREYKLSEAKLAQLLAELAAYYAEQAAAMEVS